MVFFETFANSAASFSDVDSVGEFSRRIFAFEIFVAGFVGLSKLFKFKLIDPNRVISVLRHLPDRRSPP